MKPEEEGVKKPEDEVELIDLGFIRLLIDPPLERRHKMRAGDVHRVLRLASISNPGWWVHGDGEPVMILAREAVECEGS